LELKRAGKKVKALDNAPQLLPGLGFYLGAYNDLCFDRVERYIPWSAISKWCDVHQICDIEERDKLTRIIRALESVDLQIAERKGRKND
jgi:hypothetical protein